MFVVLKSKTFLLSHKYQDTIYNRKLYLITIIKLTIMKKSISLALLFFSMYSFSQMGIGTTSPNISAQLDVSSTTKGLLPPRMTFLQRNAIVEPAAGLQIWCTDCGINGEMQAFNGATWSNFNGGTTSSPVINSSNAYCDGHYITQVVELTSSTGVIWMDRNLGASRAANSTTDYLAYGCLYQWGRGNDGHASISWTDATTGIAVNGTTTTLSSTDSPSNALFIENFTTPPYDWRSNNNNTRWQTTDQINNPCPTGFRVPNNAQYTAEFTAYGITNAAKAFSNGPSGGFKLVLSGYRTSGAIEDEGSIGNYWTNSLSTSSSISRTITSSSSSSTNNNRAFGMSVRCIKI